MQQLTEENFSAGISQFEMDELSDRLYQIDEYRLNYVLLQELDREGNPTDRFLKTSDRVVKFLLNTGQLKPLQPTNHPTATPTT